MTDITIFYNAFTESMSIHINGKPLPNVSQLTRFQSMPFRAWCVQILPQIAEEVNDNYALTFVSRNCETRILGYCAASCAACATYRPKPPQINEPIVKRLRKLNNLCLGGVPYERCTCEVNAYTDLDANAVEAAIRSALPKLCFCRFNLRIRPLAEFGRSGEREPALVILGDASLVERIQDVARTETELLLLDSEARFLGVRGMCIAEKTTSELLPSAIADCLERKILVDALSRALQGILIDEKHPQFLEVKALDKLEPQTFAILPTSVEYGRTVPIKLVTVPEGYPQTELIYRVSNESLLRIADGKITAVGTGEAIVEVYSAGNAVRLSSTKIVAYRRNRITQLQIKHEKALRLCVGDTLRLGFSYQPQDADNASSVRFISENAAIASVVNGVLAARMPGSVNIYAASEDVRSEPCRVQVYPQLEKLELTLGADQVRLGEMIPVTVRRFPEDAVLDDLIFQVEPSSLGHYDVGSKMFMSTAQGSGKLCVYDKRKSAYAEKPIKVTRKRMSGRTLFKWVVIAIIAICVLWTIFSGERF